MSPFFQARQLVIHYCFLLLFFSLLCFTLPVDKLVEAVEQQQQCIHTHFKHLTTSTAVAAAAASVDDSFHFSTYFLAEFCRKRGDSLGALNHHHYQIFLVAVADVVVYVVVFSCRRQFGFFFIALWSILSFLPN